MTRPYHSASSDALGQRCERAWFYTYVLGRRDPKVAWRDIERYVFDTDARLWRCPTTGATVQNRTRSTALGGAVHAVLEAWYRGEAPAWRGLPGQIALSGAHLLPHPDRVHVAHVETAIGSVPLPKGLPDHAPPTAYVVDGIRWAGFRDLVVSAPGEFLRLGIDAPDGWALIDHKSSADVVRYALTPAALRADFQANLYADATCTDLGIKSIPGRWVYYETKRVRRAAPVDVTLGREEAHTHVVAASARARSLDTLEREQDAMPNPAACGDYGGCPHHISAGGPCDARRSLGALVQARVTKRTDTQMGIPAAMQSTFKKFKEGAAGVEGAPDAPPAEASDTPEAPATPPPVKRGRPPKAAAAPAPAAVAAPTATTDTHQTITIPGEHAPLSISGDFRDVGAAITALFHSA